MGHISRYHGGTTGGIISMISTPITTVSNNLFAQDAEAGAKPTLFAATEDVPGGTYIGPDGIGELRGSPTIVAPRKVAHNAEFAAKLWDKSVELTGVEFNFSV